MLHTGPLKLISKSPQEKPTPPSGYLVQVPASVAARTGHPASGGPVKRQPAPQNVASAAKTESDGQLPTARSSPRLAFLPVHNVILVGLPSVHQLLCVFGEVDLQLPAVDHALSVNRDGAAA